MPVRAAAYAAGSPPFVVAIARWAVIHTLASAAFPGVGYWPFDVGGIDSVMD
jgi:hypothetical protein